MGKVIWYGCQLEVVVIIELEKNRGVIRLKIGRVNEKLEELVANVALIVSLALLINLKIRTPLPRK